MPFSSVLGASSVIKPGVCTSTTRPTVPYEGQLIYETDTDRVVAYNGSAWVYTHSSGLVLVKAETAFNAVSSVTADGVFTSAYTNYRIIIRYQCSTSAELAMKLRAATVDTSTNYNYQRFVAESSSTNAVRSTSQAQAFIGQDGGAFTGLTALELSGPQLAEPTIYQAVNTRNASAYTTPQVVQYFGNQSASTAFDGINFLVSSGTTSGSYTIYGYAKS